jgi:hypothetical protein
MIAPPRLPMQTGLDDDDRLRRVRLRLWQLGWSSLVVLVTVWMMSLGSIPGIIAVVTAKHILVAILFAGLGLDDVRSRPNSRESWQDRLIG